MRGWWAFQRDTSIFLRLQTPFSCLYAFRVYKSMTQTPHQSQQGFHFCSLQACPIYNQSYSHASVPTVSPYIWLKKIYLKILIQIIILLWTIYFIQTYFINTKEPFTPKLNSLYRPYIRDANQKYESFMNNYGPNVIINKLKKWNVLINPTPN